MTTANGPASTVDASGGILDLRAREAGPFATIVATMGEGAAVLSPGGTTLYANPSLEAMLGRHPGALHAARVDQLAHPPGDRRLAALLAGRGPRRAELALAHADGSAVPVEVSVSDATVDGSPVCCMVVAETGEDAGPPTGVPFQVAFQHAPSGMALVGSGEEILEANAAFCRLVNLSTEQVVGTPLATLTDPRDVDEHHRSARRFRAGVVDHYGCELRLRSSDGLPVWVRLVVARVRDELAGERALVHVQDISARTERAQQWQHPTRADALTGLTNRRRFFQELTHMLALEHRAPVGCALVVLDLDEFREVNAEHGHGVGDTLLRAVARMVRERVRASDVPCRLGGDEFGIALWAVDRAGARQVADDLIEAIRSLDLGMPGIRLTASAGLALVGDGPSTADALVARAEQAMDHAQRQGGDRVAVH